jgi:hypothetical protein
MSAPLLLLDDDHAMASPEPVDMQNVNVEEPSVSSLPGTSSGSGPGDGSFNFWSAPNHLHAAQGPSTGHVRLPDFWTSDPHMWFAQAEAAFRRAAVTSSIVKYDYVLMKLPEDLLRSARDLVQSVTDNTLDAYEQLKYRLLSSYGMSKWQLAGRIIDYSVAPGARPSTLLDGMMSLLPTGEQPGILFMALFLKKLPQDVRDHLCSRNFESVREMAVFADQLWDARGSLAYPMVAAIGSKSPERGRRQSKSPSKSGRSRRQTPAAEGLCFYHANYGERAHKCKPGCTWTGNGPAAGAN